MKKLLLLLLALASLLAGGATRIVQDVCGPFTDVSPAFCPFVLELYYIGITAGTSATTYSPDDPLTRGQAAVFVAKGLDQSLARSSRRAALGQWWTTTPLYDLNLGVTAVGTRPIGIASDGADLWVANQTSGTVSRVRASDGRLLETWTAATGATGILSAMGRIFVTRADFFGSLGVIDPSQPAGDVTTAAENVGPTPTGIAFDGSRIWTANQGSVSIVTPGPTLPWAVTTVTTGFTTMVGALYDGTNVWVTDYQVGTLLRLDSNGAILQTVDVGTFPTNPIFDGANIWVPNFADGSVSIVRASDGVVLTTLTGLGGSVFSAAFDGERVLVANYGSSSVSVWKAADFTPLGSFSTGSGSFPFFACSDGQSFWITLSETGQIGRF